MCASHSKYSMLEGIRLHVGLTDCCQYILLILTTLSALKDQLVFIFSSVSAFTNVLLGFLISYYLASIMCNIILNYMVSLLSLTKWWKEIILFFNISPCIYIKGADDSRLDWVALTSLSAIYIHSCGVVTILLPPILSYPCLLQVYLSLAPSYAVNFNVLLLFTLLMLDEFSFREWFTAFC